MSSLSISRDVEIAIKNNIPIVALESTIISHGMPFPQNKEVAHLMQAKIREKGCVPATIAIIRGVPTIGVDSFTIDNVLCQPPNLENKVLKASRRDLSFACANSLNAATTVSSTMLLAEKACIATFATGGIGGVHYGAEQTMDISTDLSELGKTPVAVVCAGIKSILDIKKSLEVLETNGVPVVCKCVMNRHF